MIFPEKHVSEFLRAVRNRRYEVTAGGIYFPDQKVSALGLFEISRNHGPFEVMDNLVVQEGRNYLLNAGVMGASAFSTWFVAPFATNTAPGDTLTAATFGSTLTEFTNYVESTRQAWSPVSATTSVLTNAASVATITISTGGQTAVYGAGILPGSAKGNTTAPLLAAALATTAKTGLENTETLSFRYSITLTSS